MKHILLFFSLFPLTACQYLPEIKDPIAHYMPGVYRIDVQQGNIIEQAKLNQLKPGMTPQEVYFVMGSPMILNTFAPNRWDYIYTMQPGNQDITEHKHLALYFENNRLMRLEGDFRPETPVVPTEPQETLFIVPPQEEDKTFIEKTLDNIGL